MTGVFVSWGCYKRLQEIGWFKTIGMYSLTVWEARSLKPRCKSRAMLSLKALGENPSLHLPGFWWLPAFLGLEKHHSGLSFHYHMVLFLCVSVQIFPFLIKIPVTGLGPNLIEYGLISTWLHLKDLIFNKIHIHKYQGRGLERQHIILGGHNSTHNKRFAAHR